MFSKPASSPGTCPSLAKLPSTWNRILKTPSPRGCSCQGAYPQQPRPLGRLHLSTLWPPLSPLTRRTSLGGGAAGQGGGGRERESGGESVDSPALEGVFENIQSNGLTVQMKQMSHRDRPLAKVIVRDMDVPRFLLLDSRAERRGWNPSPPTRPLLGAAPPVMMEMRQPPRPAGSQRLS